MELFPFFLLLLIGATVASGEPAHPGYTNAKPVCGMAETAPPVPKRQEEFDGGRILDISHYYREDMPTFESTDDTGVFLRLVWSMHNSSDIANFSILRLTAHSGTHIDAAEECDGEEGSDGGADEQLLEWATMEESCAGTVDAEEEGEESDSGVDVKAEEFITKFYSQMKLQRQISWLQYNEMMKRSLC